MICIEKSSTVFNLNYIYSVMKPFSEPERDLNLILTFTLALKQNDDYAQYV